MYISRYLESFDIVNFKNLKKKRYRSKLNPSFILMGDLDDSTRVTMGFIMGEVNPPARGPWGDNITVTQAIELLGSLKKTHGRCNPKKKIPKP